jgi:tetrahydromethanopterin S-methyltransferase subunit A
LLSGITQFVRRSLALQSARWPFVRGDHTVFDATAPVVVVTSGPSAIPKALAAHPPAGLSMIAVLHTADDAADLLRTLAANLAIQSVICVESEMGKRLLGAALLRLGDGDEAPAGAVGTLMNTIASRIDSAELGALRRRVAFIDMLTCREASRITARVEKLLAAGAQPNAGFVTQTTDSGVPRVTLPRDTHYESRADKAGRFKIRLEEQSIAVEHLNGKENRLLRVIEGKTARDVCLALIRNGWVSKLDHAAYLGRELARAELALRSGRPFTQDSAEPVEATPLSADR